MGTDTRQERPTEIEWCVTYKFDTDGERDAWRTSAPRVKAHAEGSGLLTSPPQETLGFEEGRAPVSDGRALADIAGSGS